MKSRWRRRALISGLVVALGVPALWVAIHEVPGVGPALADGTRAMLGPRAVAWAEDVSYDVQDRVNRWRFKGSAPKTFWEAPTATGVGSAAKSQPPPAASPASTVLDASAPAAPGSAAASGSAVAVAPPAPPAAPAENAFPPPAFTAPSPTVATEGEGSWVPMKDLGAPDQPPSMYKSLVHPDAKRGYAAVAVVAIDLRRMDLHLVAGSQEPASQDVPSDRRPGVIPKDALADLVAAFNGGFKAIHGHWGMMLGGETFVAPRDIGCTVALFRNASMKIRTWPALKDEQTTMLGYRQTPPCLVEEGKSNDALEAREYSRGWGATVSGDTVIRRSAIGVDKSRRVLFYGLGEAVTAQALSHAMRAVGAENAAQLDVNYSYPRFLVFERAAGEATPHVASALIPGIKYTRHEYVGNAEIRDFFYLTRRRL